MTTLPSPSVASLAAQSVQAGGSGTLVISGAQSASNSYFSVHGGFIVGTSTDTFPAASELTFNDQIASTSPYNGFMVHTAFGGGAMTGNRNGIASFIGLTASPNASDASQQNYVAGLFQGYANAPSKTTATGGALFANYAGGLWGINPNVFLTPNATNFYGIYGAEIDVSVQVGGNVGEKFGLMIVQGAADAVQGFLDDAAIEIGNQDGTSLGWKMGIEFGGVSKSWPFSGTSTLIGGTLRSQGPASPSIALHGVDFRSVTFQTGGKAFASSGFSVDGPTGAVTAASLTTAGAATVGSMASTGSVSASFIQGSVLVNQTATGTNQATAPIMTGQIIHVASAAAGTGIRLPATPAGTVITVINVSANPIVVYPNSGGSMDNASAGVGATLTNGTGRGRFANINGFAWFTA